MTRRKSIPAGTKREVLNRQLGVCAKCGSAGPLEFDHIHAVWNGGGDEADNLQALCETCHAHKTRGNGATTYGSDVHEAAKAKRLAKGPKKSKRAWLPFMGTWPSRALRHPTLRKKVDGTVVRRD